MKLDNCVQAVIDRSGPDIVLGLPIGAGKPVTFVNRLYARVAGDAALSLHIITGLSLNTSDLLGSGLQKKLMQPVATRLFGDIPELDYVSARNNRRLPPNVTVTEFFLRPGGYLDNDYAQQNYQSTNYTHMVRSLLALGINTVAQLIAKDSESKRLSLGSNPDLTLDLSVAVGDKTKITNVGVICEAMPFMYGPADVGDDFFDYVIDDDATQSELFSLPRPPINDTAHAIGLHASALIADGGTLQIGIGELGDAICNALILRHREPSRYRQALQEFGNGELPGLATSIGGFRPFGDGLYACTEMFIHGMLELYDADILKRNVGDNVVLHGGFLLGPRELYRRLRNMSADQRRCLHMTGISYTNQLHGKDRRVRIEQRQHARFINTAMLCTLLGAVVSDGLTDGRVVSGVGGQFDFVQMAHELADGRSIIALPSTRGTGRKLRSNIRWEYAHTTIPRHLRDIVVTEYGAADLRDKNDADVIKSMLAIADSRFQDDLVKAAKAAGKLPTDYALPEAARNNTPEYVSESLASLKRDQLLKTFPFGTEFDADEVQIIEILRRLEANRGSLIAMLRLLWHGICASPAEARPEFDRLEKRLQLDRPRRLSAWLRKQFFRGACTELDEAQSRDQ